MQSVERCLFYDRLLASGEMRLKKTWSLCAQVEVEGCYYVFDYLFTSCWYKIKDHHALLSVADNCGTIQLKDSALPDLAPRLGGIKQKKSSWGSAMNNTFLLFYSPKHRSQVWIFWSGQLWRFRRVCDIGHSRNTITYHNGLCLSPQNFA